jgi:hypothetical protein
MAIFLAPYDYVNDIDDDADDDDVDDNVDDDDNDSLGGKGEFMVLACADTLARTPLRVRQYSDQYFPFFLKFFKKITQRRTGSARTSLGPKYTQDFSFVTIQHI